MRKSLIVGLALACLVAACARPAKAWTGCYGELGLGALVADSRLDASNAGTTIAGVDGLATQSMLGGLGIGCDYSVGLMVVGILGRVDINRGETKIDFGSNSITGKFAPAWMAGGRIGILVRPETLFYGLAGYSVSKFEVSGIGDDIKVDLKGLTFGGGLETHLSGPWGLKVQYDWTRYQAGTLFDSGGLKISSEPDVHTIRAAIVYRFGVPEK